MRASTANPNQPARVDVQIDGYEISTSIQTYIDHPDASPLSLTTSVWIAREDEYVTVLPPSHRSGISVVLISE